MPGAFLLVRWFAVPAVNIVERRGLRSSFDRSRELARGNRARILVTVGLLDLSTILGLVAVGMMLGDKSTGELPLWLSSLTWTGGMLFLLYHAVLSTSLYADSRVRNEGYDVGER